MAKIVKFLGRPGRPNSNLILEGMAAWIPGEGRLFDDAYAKRYGFDSGDDFALFFTTVYNGGQKVALFTTEDVPDTETDSPDDADNASSTQER